jgi:hypothetical protein
MEIRCVLRGVEKEGMKREDGGRGGTLADLDAHGVGGCATEPLARRDTRPGISLYRHFRCAASGFSGNSESSIPLSSTFSDSSNPRPVTAFLVSGCGLLSVSPAGDRCRFDRCERVRPGSVSP